MKMQSGVQNNSGACAGDMWDIVFTTTFTCKRCQYRTSYLRDVERHIIYAHCGEVPYQCAACLSLFLSSQEALEHVQQLHGSRSRHIIENGPARWRQFQTFISRCNLVLDVDHVAGTLFLCALCEQMRTHDFAEMLRHLVSTHKWWLAQPTTTCNVCAYQRIARISELDILRVEDLMSYNGHALGACLRSCFKIVLRNTGANEAWGSSASLLQRMGFQNFPMAGGFKEPMDRRKVTFMWQPNSIPVGMSTSPANPTPPAPFPSSGSGSGGGTSPCDCGDSNYCPVVPVQNAQPLGASTLQLMEAINQRYRGQNSNSSISNDLTSIMRRPSMRGRWRRRGSELPIRNPAIPRGRSLSFDSPGQTSAERLASLCANSMSGNSSPGSSQTPGHTPIKQESGSPLMDPSLIYSLLQGQHLSASATLLLSQRNTSAGKAFLSPHSLMDDKRTLTGRLAAMWGSEAMSAGASGFPNGATTSGTSLDMKSKSSPGVSQSGDWASDTNSSEESNGTKDQISSLENYMSSKYLSGMSKDYLKGKLPPGSFSETLDNLAKQAAASASEQRDSPYSLDNTVLGNSRKSALGETSEDAVPDSSMAFSSDNSEHDGSDHPGTPLDLSKMESKSADGTDDNMDYEESVDDTQSSDYDPIRPDNKGVVNIIPVDLSVSKKDRKMYTFSGLPLDLTRKEDAVLAEKEFKPTRSRMSRKQSTPSKAVMEDFSESNEKGEHEKDPANDDLMRVLDRFFGDIDSGPFGNNVLGGIGSRPPSESDGMTSPVSGTESDVSRRQTAKSPNPKQVSNGSRSSTPRSPTERVPDPVHCDDQRKSPVSETKQTKDASWPPSPHGSDTKTKPESKPGSPHASSPAKSGEDISPLGSNNITEKVKKGRQMIDLTEEG